MAQLFLVVYALVQAGTFVTHLLQRLVHECAIYSFVRYILLDAQYQRTEFLRSKNATPKRNVFAPQFGHLCPGIIDIS